MSTPRAIGAASEEAAAFVAETGGLPQITSAAADLRIAIDQTRTEIAGADFSSRFPRVTSDYFLEMSRGAGFTALTEAAIDTKGEAGHKQQALTSRLDHVEQRLFGLIQELVAIRTDLKISQTEFGTEE